MKKFIVSLLLTILLSSLAMAVQAQGTTPQPIVRAIMFWMDGCSHCEDVIENVLPLLRDRYGSQFELLMIEVASTADVELLYQIAASYGIDKKQTGVPFVIIGEHVLVGSDQVREQLPALIEDHIAQGGLDWPSNPALQDLLPDPSHIVAEVPSPADTSVVATTVVKDNGFTLAIVIMIGMGLALLYSMVAFITGKTLPLPVWAEWLIPTLIVIGMGVAAYLSYVETQSVEAVCGPIGDCNAVQQSRYATLFGVLPVGVLGLLGYLGLLAVWLIRKYMPRFSNPADVAFFGMAFFAVIFSIYLTYLEPFVIRAVCIWCLTSAVIVTLLLLLGTPPAVLQYSVSDNVDR